MASEESAESAGGPERGSGPGAARRLRRDIHLLGELLGEVLREQGGPALLAEVESIRRACKRLRAAHTPGGAAALRRRIDALGLERAVAIARAFAIYFQLVNIAEQHHRIRRRFDHECRPEREGPQEESFAELAADLRGRGLAATEVAERLAALRVDLVSTAHPTENVRRTVLEKYQAIHALLWRSERELQSPAGRAALRQALLAEITALWQTDELRSSPPSVIDEVKNNLFYFDDILFDALPEVGRQLEAALAAAYPGARFGAEGVVRFGTWVGGDRDGNPYVTPEVTRQALVLQKRLVLSKYLRAVASVAHRLSSSATLQPASEELLDSIERDEREMPAFAAFMAGRNLEEPYRRKLFFVYRRLEVTLGALGAQAEPEPGGTADPPPPLGADPGYARAEDFAADLERIGTSLRAHGGERLDAAVLEPLLRRVRLFGFHLATMDLREHSGRHERAVAEALAAAGVCADYAGADAARQAEVLTALLRPGGWAPPASWRDRLSPESTQVWGAFAVMGWAQDTLGPEAIGPYVISMSHGVEDVLEVLFLALGSGLCGWDPAQRAEGRPAAGPAADPDGWATGPGAAAARGPRWWSRLDIAPLVETIEDLRGAAAMLTDLLAHPAYRLQVSARGRRQEVMLGYSDSTKDGGYLSANWALDCAQRELAAVAAAAGVELTFFHGRGGALGRGGGPLGRAIRAQPPETLHGRLRITQQGEVMSHRFLPREIAERTLEQVLVAVLDASTRQAGLGWAEAAQTGQNGQAAPPAEAAQAAQAPRATQAAGASQAAEAARAAEAMDRMAATSRAAYRALVEEPAFVSYFYAATPIEEIALLNIGSRPSRRKAGQRIEDLRAIPWTFAWTQSRHLVPGWYGLGTALTEHGDWAGLRAMYRGWAFFRTVVDNAAMALCKADMPIAAAYAELAGDAVPEAPAIFARIRQEYDRTVQAVLRVQGQAALLEDQPALRQSITLRNPYVDPLSYLQVSLLRRLRQPGLAEPERRRYLTAVLRTLNGVAHALRNTG